MTTQPKANKSFEAAPYSYTDARRLADQLDLAEPIAIALVRRGHTTPDAARRFLEADEIHDPFAFQGMAEAVETVLAAVEAGVRITIHGDYDVDGVSSTAIMVGVVRELGGDCDWLIPDRRDGYGLTPNSVEQLIARETELLITVDCGITSVEEVAAATAAGIEVIVTDHHTPGETLPEALILHPVLSGYPCPDLCGAGVAFKFASALRQAAAQSAPDGSGADPSDPVGGSGPASPLTPTDKVASVGATKAPDVDLAALATVADMVPLSGENRAIVRAGIAAIRRAPRPGIAALLEVASVPAEHFDEGDIGFRLGPRINAAGRLYRADAGVELLLSDDPARAAEIAAELDKANHERRSTEREVLAAAEAAVRELEGGPDAHPALVLAGEGWHAGVIGIVASRIAEQHLKPAILIAIDEKGRGKGSGRSVPGFDLLAALTAASEPLERFGGHAAAAGLEIEADRIGEFREAFSAAVLKSMPEGGPVQNEAIDAVVGADGLDMGVAQQLQELGPFGMGNPSLRLLVPWARMREVRSMGESGKHARFNLQSGTGSARGVAFGIADELAELEERPYDFSVRLEVNQWNGASEPRVVLGETYDGADHGTAGSKDPAPSEQGPACCSLAREDEWWDRFEAARSTPVAGGDATSTARTDAVPAVGAAPAPKADPASDPTASPASLRRKLIDRRSGSTIACLVELISSGAPVLALAADAERRRALAAAADPSRFGSVYELACRQCGGEQASQAFERVLERGSGLLITDWECLARVDPQLSARFEHVVGIDPPIDPGQRELAAAGSGFYHATWGPAELELASRQLAADWDLRAALGAIYRGLGASEAGSGVRDVLVGGGRYPRTAELAGRCVRVLEELSLVACDAPARTIRVVSSEKTDLERSATFVACSENFEKASRFLQNQTPAPAR